MQRIIHIVGKMDRAGAETMLMNLFRNIDRNKFQFDFVVFTNEKGDYDDEVLQLGGKIIPIVENSVIKRTIKLTKFLKENPDYKIIHAHTLFSNAFHIIAAKMANIPIIISHSHNTDDRTKGVVISKIYKSFSKSIINKFSTARIACGKEAAKSLFGNKNLQDVIILPNAIDSNYFYEIGKNNLSYIDTLFNIDEDVIKIVQIGRLQEVKNHAFSLNVAKILRDKNIPFKMFFIGKGDLHNSIIKSIQDYNLEDNVLVLGLRTDIPELMAGADLMIMPSLYEGFPVVLVESQAVGLPVLVSDNVSYEVDLKLDMINFLSLDEELWAENIIEQKYKIRKQKSTLSSIFDKEGFDIFSSVNKIEKLYTNYINNLHV